MAPQQARPGAVLLFDGIFLGRPELIAHWDLFIFVQISFETCLDRGVERNEGLLDPEEVVRQYETRYLPAQRMYLSTYQPQARADIIIKNDDPARAVLSGM